MPIKTKKDFNKKPKTFNAKVTKVLRSLSEPKHHLPFSSTTDTNSGELMGMNLTGYIPTGSNTFSRDGDLIRLEKLRSRLVINESGSYVNNGDNNKLVRIMVVKKFADNTGVSNSAWQSQPFTNSSLFQGGHNYAGIDGNADSRVINVLYDKVITINPTYGYGSDFILGDPTSTTTGYRSSLVVIDLPLHFNMQYESNAYTSKHYHLWLLVLPYTAQGSTNMIDITAVNDLVFKDVK